MSGSAVVHVIENNIGLIVECAKDLVGSGRAREYIGIGVQGIRWALNSYDPTRGTWSSHAAWNIKTAIRQNWRCKSQQKLTYAHVAPGDGPKLDALIERYTDTNHIDIDRMAVVSALKSLDSGEASVICRYYGIDRDKETCAQIGASSGVVGETIRRRADRICKKLKNEL